MKFFVKGSGKRRKKRNGRGKEQVLGGEKMNVDGEEIVNLGFGILSKGKVHNE